MTRRLYRLLFILLSCLVISLSNSRKDVSFERLVCQSCLTHCRLAWNSAARFKTCSRCIHRCNNSSYSVAQFFRENICTTAKKPIIFAQNGNLFQRIGSALPTPNTLFNTPASLAKDCPQHFGALEAISSLYSTEIVNSYRRCENDLEFERRRLRNCTALIAFTGSRRGRRSNCTNYATSSQNEEDLALQYQGRLVDDEDVPPVIKQEPSMNATVEQSRLVAFRVWAGIRGSSGPTQEVCATRPRVISPTQVKHVSGQIALTWSPGKKKQYFFIRECQYEVPPISITTKGGGPSCQMVENYHKALIVVPRGKINNGMIKSPTRTCKKIAGKSFFVCDEWVKLESHCALFIA